MFGVGGLAVAALTLFLTYRERIASLRTRFYGEQIVAYRALIDASDALTAFAIQTMTAQGEPATEDEQRGLGDALTPRWADWSTALRQHGAFVPNSVLDEAHMFNTSPILKARTERAIARNTG